jgi:hypothetical protein
VYNGYILKITVAVRQQCRPYRAQNTKCSCLGFNYRKAITLFFFSVNASYTHMNANNIASSILTNNIQQRIVLPFDNNMDSWMGSGYVSKYAFGLRTTFSAGVSVQTTKLNQIQNGIILPYNTISTTFSVGADTKVSDQVNFSYKANYTKQKASHPLLPKSKFERLIQQGIGKL